MALTRLLTGPDPNVRATRWIAGLLTVPLAVVVLSGQTVVRSAALTPTDTSIAVPVTLPDPAILTARLKAVSTRGIKQKSIIVTTTDGHVLANRGADTPLTPASTMKVLTTMAAVDILGPDRTFATRTVDAGDGRVVVIGGGDPFLTDKASTRSYKPASLATLAVGTASALKAAGHTTISLRYDASLFSGPLFSPKWKSKWRTYEARVAALEINSGKLGNGKASTNPAKTAANALAKRLRAAGITVTSVAAGKATSASPELSRVTSATVSTIVQRTLLVSDNVAAETLLRQSAVARGMAGSFTAASENLHDWLAAHSLWAPGQKIYDGSGLAPASKLTTATLAGAIRLALADATFAPVIAGLPIAGETGTLKDRFDDKSERAGRHTVHAKTGTLSGLAGLAGYLTTADGAVLVFAELGDKATSSYRVYNWLDREAAVVARCGCR
ncbi:MAG TPA: D-alanyl-D-alanine carboxypeptidase/D-alanyl-D-alanine-endopeptidase [Propionicimonas sp.]|jgi:D-alanyl-D-alanine carboxypeptidase/D-alanyl-D-alanine-endopeptidase (penicillin-binding protein 4)|uniref:D-alanyl-D-alanine carboxypeptidase/D-alanyl-D-alanine endopeptidase n=1 Tax=Propionicimonas sp. TaxID=1955623 RepID=UPI002F400734